MAWPPLTAPAAAEEAKTRSVAPPVRKRLQPADGLLPSAVDPLTAYETLPTPAEASL